MKLIEEAALRPVDEHEFEGGMMNNDQSRDRSKKPFSRLPTEGKRAPALNFKEPKKLLKFKKIDLRTLAISGLKKKPFYDNQKAVPFRRVSHCHTNLMESTRLLEAIEN